MVAATDDPLGDVVRPTMIDPEPRSNVILKEEVFVASVVVVQELRPTGFPVGSEGAGSVVSSAGRAVVTTTTSGL